MASSDPNRGAQIQAVAAVFLALTWISVTLRCFVRIHILKSFSIDDHLMVLALIIYTLYTSFLFAAVHYGLGQHNDLLPQAVEIKGMEYTNISTMIYILNMAVVKSSIAFFLLRLAVFPVYRWILKTSMVIVVLWSLATFLFDVFTCNPVAYQWDTTIQGHCVSDASIEAAALSFSIMGIASDWLYALIPIPIIWNVKMNIQVKIGVAAILSLGIFASVATLVRLKYLTDIASQADFLYQAVDAGIWTNVELGLSIVAASIVTLRPLLRALKIHGFSNDDTASSHRRNRSNSAGPWNSHPRGSHRTQISSAGGLEHDMDGTSQTELQGIKIHTTIEQADARPNSQGSEELIFEGPRRSSVGGAGRGGGVATTPLEFK